MQLILWHMKRMEYLFDMFLYLVTAVTDVTAFFETYTLYQGQKNA
jgi:hypothetical protein